MINRSNAVDKSINRHNVHEREPRMLGDFHDIHIIFDLYSIVIDYTHNLKKIWTKWNCSLLNATALRSIAYKRGIEQQISAINLSPLDLPSGLWHFVVARIEIAGNAVSREQQTSRLSVDRQSQAICIPTASFHASHYIPPCLWHELVAASLESIVDNWNKKYNII